MESLNKVVSSFNIQDNLHPKIWYLPNEKHMSDPEGQKYKLNPKVRKNLLEIAYQFIDSFGLDVVIDDIIITGSIANYNWSKYSDIDVHILVDYNQFNPKLKDTYVEYFDMKKIIFNEKRNVKLFDFDVELFVEDADAKGISDGVYSLMNDEWLKEPSKKKTTINKSEIIKNSKKWMRIIDTLLKHLEGESPETIINNVKKIKTKLKKYRIDGLKGSGELGLENLVFKVLRRKGYIQKLYSEPIKLIDNKLSLKEAELSSPLETTIVGSKFGAVRPGLDTKKPHSGVDLKASTGTPIYSPDNGLVVKSDMVGNNGGCGGSLFIKHKDGFESRFCHCSDILVKVGDSVKKGQKVALSGGGKNDRGRGFSTGAHLHYTLVKDGVLVDPMNFIGSFTPMKALTKMTTSVDGTIKKIMTILKKPEYKDVELEKLKEKKKDIKILEDLIKIINEKKELKFSRNNSFDESVLIIQKILKVLGYADDDFKINGIYDLNTQQVVKEFQTDNDLSSTGTLNTEDLKVIYFLVLANELQQAEFDKIELDKVDEFSNPDLLIYQEILTNLGAPISKENLRFLYALRNSFTDTKAKNNPFNVKFNLIEDPKMTDYNKTETKNYSSPEFGIKATIKTLKQPRYKCIVDSLKIQETADGIARCEILQNIGIQDEILELLKNENLIPIKISN